MDGVRIIFVFGVISYSLSTPNAVPNPLDKININLNLGQENNGKDYYESGKSEDGNTIENGNEGSDNDYGYSGYRGYGSKECTTKEHCHLTKFECYAGDGCADDCPECYCSQQAKCRTVPNCGRTSWAGFLLQPCNGCKNEDGQDVNREECEISEICEWMDGTCVDKPGKNPPDLGLTSGLNTTPHKDCNKEHEGQTIPTNDPCMICICRKRILNSLPKYHVECTIQQCAAPVEIFGQEPCINEGECCPSPPPC